MFKNHFEMGKEENREVAKRTPNGDRKKIHENGEKDETGWGDSREGEGGQERNTAVVRVTAVTKRPDK